MENRHAAPRRGPDPRRQRAARMANARRRPPRGKSSHRRPSRRAIRAGWIFLAGALVLALVLALTLGRGKGRSPAADEAAPASGGPGSAFSVKETAAPIQTVEGSGGRWVKVGAFQTGFDTPETVTVGVLKSADLTALGETVRQNVASAGWGDIVCSLGQNGELLLRNAAQIVLGGGDFEKQEAFLATAQPENLARTFLENSALIPLLRDYGLTLSTEAENAEGMITFRGTGNAPGAECAISFSFLYTGAFNQAVLRATYLEGAIVTDRVLSLREAAEKAVTWSSADTGAITVTDAELRQIRGLPFYVLGGMDGTVAYALAVEEEVLAAVPGAEAVYRELMQNGIQEYVEIPGAA